MWSLNGFATAALESRYFRNVVGLGDDATVRVRTELGNNRAMCIWDSRPIARPTLL